jgi:hypothetical protein
MTRLRRRSYASAIAVSYLVWMILAGAGIAGACSSGHLHHDGDRATDAQHSEWHVVAHAHSLLIDLETQTLVDPGCCCFCGIHTGASEQDQAVSSSRSFDKLQSLPAVTATLDPENPVRGFQGYRLTRFITPLEIDSHLTCLRSVSLVI